MPFYPYSFFFFKQKTAYEILRSDWSSDVCSSDLGRRVVRDLGEEGLAEVAKTHFATTHRVLGKAVQRDGGDP